MMMSGWCDDVGIHHDVKKVKSSGESEKCPEIPRRYPDGSIRYKRDPPGGLVLTFSLLRIKKN